MVKNTLAFNFLKDRHVASFFPTTKRTISRICKSINFERNIVIVEYGPGTGVFTKYLLSKMSEKSRIVAIEKNKQLASNIKKEIKDKRLKIINSSAENVGEILKKEGIIAVDYVLSGIPLSFLTPSQRESLLSNTYKVLKNKGKMLIYQFSKKSIRFLLSHFDSLFCYSQPLNIPPLFIFEAEKK